MATQKEYKHIYYYIYLYYLITFDMTHTFLQHPICRLFLTLLLLIHALPSTAFAWTGKVIGVTDGDTIHVLRNREDITIRLYGIDTPEKGQAFGSRAKKATSKHVRGKKVEVTPIDTDRHGRTVALVERGGWSLNQQLISDGYAWVYGKYCKESFCKDWYKIEASAKKEQKGMWRDSHIVPPWEWRYGKRSAQNPNPDKVKGPYHGNVSSKSFHKSSCKHFNCKNCTIGLQTREEALAAGYRPCGICKP